MPTRLYTPTMNFSTRTPQSYAFDHSPQKQRPSRQFGDHNIFVSRVCPFSHPAHSIKRRNTHTRGKVSVGTSAHRRFLQIPLDFTADFPGFLIERCTASGTFHRQTVNRPGDLQAALPV